jgi:hypothetical protein
MPQVRECNRAGTSGTERVTLLRSGGHEENGVYVTQKKRRRRGRWHKRKLPRGEAVKRASKLGGMRRELFQEWN